ncbi:hypothetical protein BKA63DRAFT_487153 [Paraphoma chrysanthemicola]|nr:hypothetical protein BKA63DRAFT_487153 [Paraphoma chrysanthemicola]
MHRVASSCENMLSAAVRALVIHEYLLLERQAGRLSTRRHDDKYGNRCCVWEYPKTLIACDNQDSTTFPPPKTARTPQGWLPTLTFTSKPMPGEVTVHMLRGTERFDLKYIKNENSFKIATWLRQFIAAIPGNDGFTAVKYLNFPHMHWFDTNRDPPAPENPSVELMVACKNLRKVDMTFHASVLSKSAPDGGLLRWQLSTTSFWRGSNTLDLVESTCEGWIKKGFLVRRNQVVKVEVVRRYGRWTGRLAGTVIELSDGDMEEVAKLIQICKRAREATEYNAAAIRQSS